MVLTLTSKILSLTSLAFIVALFATPLLTHFLYKHRLGKNIRNDGSTPIFSKLHAGKQGTPTMGGILIWGTVSFLLALFWFLDRTLHISFFHPLNFLTRRETLLPFGAFIGASLVGLADDFLDIRNMGHGGRGFRFRFKVLLYAFVAAIGAWWFYAKIGFDIVHIPLVGSFSLGLWFIPFFLFVVVGTSFAVNQTDGLDGLAGGTLLIAFVAYMLICFSQGRENLAGFLGAIAGSLLAFLWFNVFPARFFMGDTGSMGMGVVLALVAFLTNTIFLLPIIGFIFFIEAVSTVVQLASKKLLHKKVFLAAPLHHHFEARGWPETKVTMRFWIIGAVFAISGVILFLIDKTY
jgi:phospho-N-acetylmuramoyl-pentapeptide-transferase